MKVMYFAFEGFDTQNGTNHLALKMLDTFLENNIQVYLVSSHTLGIYEDIPETLKGRKGFSYDIVNRKIVGKQNFVQRYLDGYKYAIDSMKMWRKQKDDIDVVILQSCPTVFFSSVLLKWVMKKPVIFNYYDIFPNGPKTYGAIKNNLIYSVLHFMQKIVYKNSQKIVVISEDMKNTLVKEGVKENKIDVIPCWYDETQVNRVEDYNNLFLKKYNIDINNKFILQYAGNFGYTFDYKAIIEIAKSLIKYENIEFHMIGTGGFEKEFKQSASDNRLNNIHFFEWQPAEILSDVYSYCDIEIIPLSKGVIYTSYPSKTSLLMACGKVFVCITEADSVFYEKINNQQIGFCVPREDYDTAVATILSLYNKKTELQGLSEEIQRYGEYQFSSRVNANKYIKIMQDLI